MRDAQINFHIDSDAIDLAKEKLDHSELSRRLRETVEQIAFGEEVSKHAQLQQLLRTLRVKKDDLRAERRELDAELETIEQEITRVEEQLSELDKREDNYESALEMLEETLAGDGDLRAKLHDFAYAPFGGGPCICIGREFALLEA